ncbi:hypothetical protein A2U01_0016795, partial [Trifolium medium]|nr:hypothetical protein [Trifolium medium]
MLSGFAMMSEISELETMGFDELLSARSNFKKISYGMLRVEDNDTQQTDTRQTVASTVTSSCGFGDRCWDCREYGHSGKLMQVYCVLLVLHSLEVYLGVLSLCLAYVSCFMVYVCCGSFCSLDGRWVDRQFHSVTTL